MKNIDLDWKDYIIQKSWVVQNRVNIYNLGLVRSLKFRFESGLTSKSSLTLFAFSEFHDLMLYKDMGKITRENALEQKNKKPRFKFNPGLVLISLRTTGPSVLECDKHILNL